MGVFTGNKFATRPERSSFCETKWSKKAGVEDGKSRPKNLIYKIEKFALLAANFPEYQS
jgi:hypothetical protein